MDYDKKKVVILGGGYAGLMTAVTLQKKVHPSRIEIYLVNKNDYHYFTTKVHEAGAGTVNPESIKLPILELIDSQRVTFIQDEVTGLDIERKRVICKNQTLNYDYVVVGIGGTPKTSNIPGLEEHAFFLFNWEGTYRLRQHIEEKFQEFSQQRAGKLNLVIGGTGFTGMEFIHELTNSIPILCKRFKVVPNDVNIIVVEPNQGILQGFPEAIVSDAVNSLRKTNIEYKVGLQVTRVEDRKIILEDGTEVPTDTFIWAGGVMGNPLLDGLGFELLDGRVKLNEFCEVPGCHDVYVIGDASVSLNEKGNPYLPTAQIAIQQGQYCAYNMAMKIYGQPTKPFQYIHRGTVISLGKGNATGIVYDHHISGHFAAWMKWMIEMRYYFMLGGLPLVRKQWKN
ncbi:NAD(P)/FAD-dependent oxidoreductase [Neobacillus sp. OS1-33]|uniref:NAD(P)/FAD-dependent oxidoreductase n=1 Tax=Neobacillus sp. OS1-33 TaxID=3070683 RepID=UPI0027E03BF8|nr:NAD(P)/FAD-dependent oxidoreductase [Neobacillus sp. OS1-33]WML26518.1 NAD(P)/FAD-dependent oxidoreductase [Neobacillus sp. OS1-33]